MGLATEPDRHALVGLSGDEPVALLDVERYEDATASVAIVVSPEVRRQGIGTAVLASIFTHAELTGTELVFGEVEQGNAGAERLVCAAGFALDNEGARTEGFSRWALRRPA